MLRADGRGIQVAHRGGRSIPGLAGHHGHDGGGDLARGQEIFLRRGQRGDEDQEGAARDDLADGVCLQPGGFAEDVGGGLHHLPARGRELQDQHQRQDIDPPHGTAGLSGRDIRAADGRGDPQRDHEDEGGGRRTEDSGEILHGLRQRRESGAQEGRGVWSPRRGRGRGCRREPRQEVGRIPRGSTLPALWPDI